MVAVDGKTLRRSHDKSNGKSAIHMVSAWASANGIVLGQVKTDEKSNEITAIPELIKTLEIEGCIVTIDAMGCQKKIAKQIVDQKADYVLSLKQNQESLYNDVVSIFKQGKEIQFKKMLNCRIVEKVHGHGRVETRRYTLISARDPLLFKLRWPGFNGIGML